MPKYKHILALDPSGNFEEGKGTTGWVVMNYKEKLIASGAIAAIHYRTKEEYYEAIIDLINKNYNKYRDGGFIVVMEDYVLYRDKAITQTNSKMETCRLLGILQYHCWLYKIPYTMQLAASVKHRWSNELLLRERILYQDRDGLHHTETKYWMNVPHILDAFRHAIHFCLCRNDESKTKIKANKPTRFSNYSGDYDAESNYKGRPRKTEINHGSYNDYQSNRHRTRVWRP